MVYDEFTVHDLTHRLGLRYVESPDLFGEARAVAPGEVLVAVLRDNTPVAAPGTQFDLEVFVENPKDWLMGLLVVGFDQVAEGFTALGGFTSRGLGRVTLRWEEMLRYDAATLLAGGEAEVFDPSALRGRFNVYRAALAARVKGA